MKVTHTPRGVCTYSMTVEEKDGIITDVQLLGGCDGNLQGIARLVRGMPVGEAAARLEGIRCGGKATSCPDQLAKALRKLQEQKASDSGGAAQQPTA